MIFAINSSQRIYLDNRTGLKLFRLNPSYVINYFPGLYDPENEVTSYIRRISL